MLSSLRPRFADLDPVQPALEQPVDAFVTQIAKAQRGDAGAQQKATPCLLQRSRRPREDGRLIYRRALLPIHQRIECTLRQRHLTTRAVLCQSEREHPAIV